MAVWAVDEYEFHSCPIIFITKEITDWYREYSAIKNGLVQPDRYDEKQARWFDASDIYNNYYLRFESEKSKKPKKQIKVVPKKRKD